MGNHEICNSNVKNGVNYIRIEKPLDVIHTFQKILDVNPNVEILSYAINPGLSDNNKNIVTHMSVPTKILFAEHFQSELQNFSYKTIQRIDLALPVSENEEPLSHYFRFSTLLGNDSSESDCHKIVENTAILPGSDIQVSPSIIDLLSHEKRISYFGSDRSDMINRPESEIRDALANSGKQDGVSQPYFVHNKYFKFLYFHLDSWDIISTNKSVHPNIKNYHLKVLQDNIFFGGSYYLLFHNHTDFPDWVWNASPFLRLAEKRYSRRMFLGLLNPGDTSWMWGSHDMNRSAGRVFLNRENFDTRIVATATLPVIDKQVSDFVILDTAILTEKKTVDQYYELSDNAEDEMSQSVEEWDFDIVFKYYDFVAENSLINKFPKYLGNS